MKSKAITKSLILLFTVSWVYLQVPAFGDESKKASPEAVSQDNSKETKKDDINLDKLGEGNRFYSEGKMKEALAAYGQAGIKDPDNPIINYNIGNVLYKQGKIGNSINNYAKASAFPESAYNIGNALFRLKQLEKALDSYRQVLLKNPDDLDAKFNYEFTKKLLEKQKDSKYNSKKQGGDKKQQEKKKQQENKSDKKQGKGQQKSKSKQKRIDPQKANEMLRALAKKERDLQKKLLKAKKAQPKKVEKDW